MEINMNKKSKWIIIISTIVLVVSIITLIFIIYNDNKIDTVGLRAIVMRVNEDGLDVMVLQEETQAKNESSNSNLDINEDTLELSDISEVPENNTKVSLCRLNFTEEGNIGFKKGQEIIFYFHGMWLDSFPGQVTRTG